MIEITHDSVEENEEFETITDKEIREAIDNGGHYDEYSSDYCTNDGDNYDDDSDDDEYCYNEPVKEKPRDAKQKTVKNTVYTREARVRYGDCFKDFQNKEDAEAWVKENEELIIESGGGDIYLKYKGYELKPVQSFKLEEVL